MEMYRYQKVTDGRLQHPKFSAAVIKRRITPKEQLAFSLASWIISAYQNPLLPIVNNNPKEIGNINNIYWMVVGQRHFSQCSEKDTH